MSELTSDIWMDETLTMEQAGVPCRPPLHCCPVMDIILWLDCYVKMAAVLTTIPREGQELWANQATIIQAARDF